MDRRRVSTIPDTLEAPDLDDYLAVMTRAVFQAGLSWSIIAQRWHAFEVAFRGFDARAVAQYDDGDIERALSTDGMLKSSKKIRATIHNAQRLVELAARPGGVRSYLDSFESYDTLVVDFRKRFKFMGEMNVWYFLFRVREPVPTFERWVQTIRGDHPRMAEMVERARALGTSTESDSR